MPPETVGTLRDKRGARGQVTAVSPRLRLQSPSATRGAGAGWPGVTSTERGSAHRLQGPSSELCLFWGRLDRAGGTGQGHLHSYLPVGPASSGRTRLYSSHVSGDRDNRSKQKRGFLFWRHGDSRGRKRVFR